MGTFWQALLRYAITVSARGEEESERPCQGGDMREAVRQRQDKEEMHERSKR